METAAIQGFNQLDPPADFPNHFPARGWKPQQTPLTSELSNQAFLTISPQGDGNLTELYPYAFSFEELAFPNHFPARGWKRKELFGRQIDFVSTFLTISPQGDGNRTPGASDQKSLAQAFLTIFPQGDGNMPGRNSNSCRKVHAFLTISPQGDGNPL